MPVAKWVALAVFTLTNLALTTVSIILALHSDTPLLTLLFRYLLGVGAGLATGAIKGACLMDYLMRRGAAEQHMCGKLLGGLRGLLIDRRLEIVVNEVAHNKAPPAQETENES